MRSPITSEAHVFLHAISLVTTSFVINQSSYLRTDLIEALTGYPKQKITEAWMVMAYAAEMRPFSKMFALYLMLNCTKNAFGILPSKEHVIAPELEVSALEEASRLGREKEEVAAEVWKTSAVVQEALRDVSYLYMEHVSSVLTGPDLYMEHII